MPADTAIYALTATGADTARKLNVLFSGDCYVLDRYSVKGDRSFTSLSSLLQDTFAAYENHVFVAASGIVVRLIAPLLRSKAEDPAVVVLDQDGKFAISLVSGHLGGANELARLIADRTGATAVITTATDCAGVPSMDILAREQGMAIGNLGSIKHVNAAVLDGEKVSVLDRECYLDLTGIEENFHIVEGIAELLDSRCGIVVDWRVHDLPDTVLVLHPRCLTLGVGCRRGVPAKEIIDHIDSVLLENRIAAGALMGMGSIEAKKDEPGLIEAAEILGLELQFYSAAELGEIEVANPSGMVMKHMGVGGVCEAAAMKMADVTEILIPKTKSARVTAALARVASRS